MPELPEVETVRRGLRPAIGVPITGVRIARRDVVRDDAGRRRGGLGPGTLLEGDRVATVERHGKQLALVGASGRVVLIHLGMSGQVLLGADAHGGDHTHAVWTLGDGRRIAFRDPRRFGGIWLMPDIAALKARWRTLGPDGLGVRGKALAGNLGGSRRPLKAGLLDQRAIAGVGNIYADESLFEARIAPQRPCDTLSTTEWDRLAEAIRGVLGRAVKQGGSTLRDYRRPDGSVGGAAVAHRVYGKSGKPCPSCGGLIQRALLAQRSTCWCPHCQH